MLHPCGWFNATLRIVTEIDPIYCQPDQVMYLIACGILSFLIICANLIVIIVYLKTKNKKLKSCQTIYRTSIAFSDIITGTFVLPTIIVCWTLKRQRKFVDGTVPDVVLLCLGFPTTLSSIVSITTLLLSACDRVFAIAFPMPYHIRTVLMRKIALIASLIIWSCGILFSSLPFFSKDVYLLASSETIVILLLSGDGEYWGVIIFFIISLSTLIISGIAISILVKYSRNARNLSSSVSRRWSLERQVAVTHCFMILAFIVSVSPAIGLRLALPLVRSFNTSLTLIATATFLYYANSLWNCLVYSFRSKEFRDEARKIFHPLFEKLKYRRLRNRNVQPQNVVEREGRQLPETAV